MAIVGAGVTGCSCALTLAEGGLRVRVHEAREVAGGASGRNGGFALRGTAEPYDVARARLAGAAELWKRSEQALDELAALAGDAFARTGSLRLAADPDQTALLRSEYEALREDGFAPEWWAELDGPLAKRFAAALFHPGDGAIQPARWVRRLAARAAEAGAEIREHDPVHALEELEADQIVIATDGYTRGLLASLDHAVKPTRGQVVTTEPLGERLFPRPHYTHDGFQYWHQPPDGRLVLGGYRDRALDQEWTHEERTTEVIQEALTVLAGELVGTQARITHRWSGIFGTTDDLLPLVGPVPGHEGLWVSCGYSGHGNVLGFACGRLVADAILGRQDDLAEVFDPARLLSPEPA